MKVVEIRQANEMDETLRQQLPHLIREAWRKVYVNMGAYTKDYEENEAFWGIPMIEQELAKGSRLFAVQEQGRWLAAVFADEVTHETEAAFQLRTLAVHPNWQGRGLAEWLIDTLADIGAREGKRFLTLYTSSMLTKLVQFYERIGFTEYKREEVERFGKCYARVFLQRVIQKA